MNDVPTCQVELVSVVMHKESSPEEQKFRTARFRIRVKDSNGRLRTRVGGYNKLVAAFGPSVASPIKAAWSDYVYTNA
ncbi:hypothetical protein COV06_03640 [Candidatus Uhrbacteria bacterium CG10_big_fil_rev_8_21_14_0_10_50_16]|uniref:Uncharacterized protein n=1 Tax=Candidatus Uhrbacteria bacterium CG10_big_fil_rev_8_21_14_0_10_50_16 TaxID=1975039 RepID=A0A2H0RM49_9BACT|nr:MAG: hypothetical protein COV06_03640 [Candidatus Uhrbacteria bacterium CG10_big_fil_rev_8_21_14_0_10_50_16]